MHGKVGVRRVACAAHRVVLCHERHNLPALIQHLVLVGLHARMHAGRRTHTYATCWSCCHAATM